MATATQNSSFYQNILDASPSPMIVLERHHQKYLIVYRNAAFEHRTGHCARGAAATDWSILTGADSRELRLLRGALDSGEPAQAVLRCRCHDGSSFWTELLFAPMERGAGPTRYVCILRDITTDRAQREHLERRALYDALTGLPNRHLFQQRMDRAIADARSRNGKFAVAVMDLDYFKQVNDTFGHEAGDEVLKQIGARANGVLRTGDTIARIGGDEFVLLLEAVDDECYASQILSRVAEVVERPVAVAGTYTAVGCSIGVSWYPFDGNDTAALLRQADSSMYGEKKRNRLRLQVNGGRVLQPSRSSESDYPRLELVG